MRRSLALPVLVLSLWSGSAWADLAPTCGCGGGKGSAEEPGPVPDGAAAAVILGGVGLAVASRRRDRG